jgi:hypothetical protein
MYVFSDFWKCIRTDKLVKDEVTRKWTLKENVLWLGYVQTLYNRKCYDDIIDNMAGKKLVLIIGTTGIGKSLFLRRFLVHINELFVNKGGKFPLIYIYKKPYDDIEIYSLLENGNVVQINNPKTRPDYLLSDSVDLRKCSYNRSSE